MQGLRGPVLLQQLVARGEALLPRAPIELGVPDVHNQHNARRGAVVPDRVDKGVVKREAAPLGPRARLG